MRLLPVLAGFGLAAALAACALEPATPPPPPPPAAPPTPLEAFRREHPYGDAKRWFTLEVTRSAVTETARRIRFEKEAVTRALVAHKGGGGFNAAPMAYEPGTVFVAESLDPDGKVRDTEVLVVGPAGGRPSFLLFGADGQALDTFAQPNDPPSGPRKGNVPAVCLGCHEGTSFFDPMMSFPREPLARRLIVDSRCRDDVLVSHFLEGYHRGGRLFGPYGAMWLGKIRSDARDGFVLDEDRTHYERLKERYPELFGPAGDVGE
jgi:hypothetical protein